MTSPPGEDLPRSTLQRLVTQNQDALEALETLGMTLARRESGAVCQFELVNLSALSAPRRYDLGAEVAWQFLAGTSVNRSQGSRRHFENFSQALWPVG